MSIKLLVVTAQTPWGKVEGFIIGEMFEMMGQGVELLVIPRNPPGQVFHKNAQRLVGNAIWLPLINSRMIINFFKNLFSGIALWRILWDIVANSRNIRILIKNLAVLPKGAFVAEILKKKKIGHIHAHWGSTTSTMAYVISKLAQVSWSLTLHRWDIKEDNILKEKVKTAKFVRCISRSGKKELLDIIGDGYEGKIAVIHMGVKVPTSISAIKNRERANSRIILVTPANLLEVKGHKYLIDACSILLGKGVRNFQCVFYGEGPQRAILEKQIREQSLTEHVIMRGTLLSQEKLMEKYEKAEVNAVILPSIVTSQSEREGIPVSAMEAMAYGVPVVSTNTGGIPELLGDRAGIIVNQKSSIELAEAISRLIENEGLRLRLGQSGHERVRKEFDVKDTTRELLRLISDGEVSMCRDS